MTSELWFLSVQLCKSCCHQVLETGCYLGTHTDAIQAESSCAPAQPCTYAISRYLVAAWLGVELPQLYNHLAGLFSAWNRPCSIYIFAMQSNECCAGSYIWFHMLQVNRALIHILFPLKQVIISQDTVGKLHHQLCNSSRLAWFAVHRHANLNFPMRQSKMGLFRMTEWI